MKSLRPLSSHRANEAQQVRAGKKGKDRENNSLSLPIDLFAPTRPAPAARVYRACARDNRPIDDHPPGGTPCTRRASIVASGSPRDLNRTKRRTSSDTGITGIARGAVCAIRLASSRSASTRMATSTSRSHDGQRHSPATGAASSRAESSSQLNQLTLRWRDRAAIRDDRRYFQREIGPRGTREQPQSRTDFRRPVRTPGFGALGYHVGPRCDRRPWSAGSPNCRQLGNGAHPGGGGVVRVTAASRLQVIGHGAASEGKPRRAEAWHGRVVGGMELPTQFREHGGSA